MLDTWLEYHRATLAMKCDGLTDEQLRTQSVPPSNMSLLGLVRHMADVELNWFRRVLNGEAIRGGNFWTEENADTDPDFEFPDDTSVPKRSTVRERECATAREIVWRRSTQLDDAGERRGETYLVAVDLVHMIEEYARHNGHADLLRERHRRRHRRLNAPLRPHTGGDAWLLRWRERLAETAARAARGRVASRPLRRRGGTPRPTCCERLGRRRPRPWRRRGARSSRARPSPRVTCSGVRVPPAIIAHQSGRVAVLARRHLLALGAQHAQGLREHAARVARVDDVVDVAALGRLVRVERTVPRTRRRARSGAAIGIAADSISRRKMMLTAPAAAITAISADGHAYAMSAPIDFEFMTTYAPP